MKAILSTLEGRRPDLPRWPVPPTLAEVRATIATWNDLPATKIRKLQTALSTLGRALAPGQSRKVVEAHIRLDCRAVRPFRAVPAATSGLSSSRRASALSEIVYVLQRLGLHEPKSRGVPITSPSLKVWYDRLPQGHQVASIDFFRHLDRDGLELGQVTAETLGGYRGRKETWTVCPNPDSRVAQVVTAFNWASKNVSGWPLPTLRLRPSAADEVLTLPLTRFSEPFQEDVRRCLSRLAGADLRLALFDADPADTGIDSSRNVRNMRPESLKGVLMVIRSAASILVRQGVPITELTSLRDLFSPFDRIRAILEAELDRNQGKSRCSLHKLASNLVMLGSRYCGLPKAEVEQLRTWTKRLGCRRPRD